MDEQHGNVMRHVLALNDDERSPRHDEAFNTASSSDQVNGIGFEPPHFTHSYLDWVASELNKEFFGNKLPPVLINIVRRGESEGFFGSGQYFRLGDRSLVISEIGLNPRFFTTPENVFLSTLHQLVHLSQAIEGTAPKNQRHWHNLEFAKFLAKCGVKTECAKARDAADGEDSHLNADPSKKVSNVGDHVRHTVETDGLFDRFCLSILGKRPPILYPDASILAHTSTGASPEVDEGAKARAEAKRKRTFACDRCTTRVTGKPGTEVLCARCNRAMPEVLRAA